MCMTCAAPHRIGDQCECSIGSSGSTSLMCPYVQLHNCTNMQHFRYNKSSLALYLYSFAVMAPMAKCVQALMQGSVCVDSAGVDRMSTHRSDSFLEFM